MNERNRSFETDLNFWSRIKFHSSKKNYKFELETIALDVSFRTFFIVKIEKELETGLGHNKWVVISIFACPGPTLASRGRKFISLIGTILLMSVSSMSRSSTSQFL